MTPTVVRLPGMNCSADLWRGCGIPGTDLTIDADDVDRQVERWLRVLPDRLVIVGLSLGAVLGMALAVRAPARVAALCVMSTNGKAPTAPQREGWTSWLARLDAGVSARALQESILPSLLSARAVDDPALVERALAMADATGSARLAAQLALQGTRRDLRPALRGLHAPTLVLSGADDAICPPAFHAEIAGAVEGAQLVSIRGGHLLPMEQPDAVGQAFHDWYDRVVGRA